MTEHLKLGAGACNRKRPLALAVCRAGLRGRFRLADGRQKLAVSREGFDSSAFLKLLFMESKYLGKSVPGPIEELDSFEAPEGVTMVTLTSDELASSCPITGQPDLYSVSIEYVPQKLCIESKSLKLYLWGFRDKAMFAEKIAAVICDRVVADIAPKSCRVETVQKARGGVTILSLAEFPRSEAS